MAHLCARFLEDKAEYAQAEDFWIRLWEGIPADLRGSGHWKCGWFDPQAIQDGNPIFTAISENQRKAIRVIQYEPTCDQPEIDFWLDTFGGNGAEPRAIRELVIACALSTETAEAASRLMSSWIGGSEADLRNIAGVDTHLAEDGRGLTP